MSRRRIAPWFAGALAAGLLLLLPLQLLLPRLPLPSALTATRIDGHLWHGRLHQVHWRSTALGDVHLGLSPLPLLAGRTRLWLQAPGARLQLHAGRARGFEHANGVLPLPAPAGLALRASLEDAALLFDGDGCRRASGRVRVELAFADAVEPPLVLAGAPACAGREGVIELRPEQASSPLQVEARFEVDGTGAYRLQSLARADDPLLRAALLAAGFQQAPGGFSRVDTGRLDP